MKEPLSREEFDHPALPDNYYDLSKNERRLVRLGILADQSTPANFVRAWEFFREYYLRQTPNGFFYDDLLPSPQLHYDLIHDVGEYNFNAFAAPRGFAKSTIISKELPVFLLLTRPYFKIALCLATDNMVEKHFDIFIKQFTENKLIIADFGVLKPPRGQAIWNHHMLTLNNGSIIEGFSVGGRKRGARPHLFILDDPEYDPENNSETAAALRREQFDTLLFKQIIPMLKKGCGICWVGTIINVRCYLYYACYEEDPRFKTWNRKLYTAEDDEGRPVWEEMWDEDALALRKEQIGEAAYASEYLNKPASDQDRMLDVDPIKNEYVIEKPSSDVPPLLDDNSVLRYHIKPDPRVDRWEQLTTTPAELYGNMFKMLTFDYAQGLQRQHDYSSICVSGFDRNRCLWVLDLWLGRARKPVLIKNIYDMALRWNVRVIGIETCGMQVELVDAMEDYLEALIDGPDMFHPKVVPIKYGKTESKGFRISGLERRFKIGKIKYPRHLKNSSFGIKQLYAQTADFTPDLALLPFDDAIDSLAMTQYIIKGKGPNKIEEGNIIETLDQKLVSTNPWIAPGVHALSGYNASDLTPEQLRALMNKGIRNPASYVNAKNRIAIRRRNSRCRR